MDINTSSIAFHFLIGTIKRFKYIDGTIVNKRFHFLIGTIKPPISKSP
ncbi:TPA: hypothetical protein N2E01_001433 [Clostridium botulinum]|nr:hypothetical protein [Clostridium botulinum]HCL4583633.1 hypothetical protein [Clostridium botulinum]HCL4587556.1 hypothetical protein [Clostridium botulinum]